MKKVIVCAKKRSCKKCEDNCGKDPDVVGYPPFHSMCFCYVINKKYDGFPRARYAGFLAGFVICEMIDLMYQDNTALNFLNGLISILTGDQRDRNKRMIGRK